MQISFVYKSLKRALGRFLHNLAQLQKTNAKKFAEQADTLAIRLAAVAPPVMRAARARRK